MYGRGEGPKSSRSFPAGKSTLGNQRPRVIDSHGVEGLAEPEIYDIFGGDTTKVIEALGGCSCKVAFDESTTLAA